MPLPKLIHPVPILVETINEAQTVYDDDFREPIQHSVRNTETEVPGQVKWGSEDKFNPSRIGAEEDSDGYVLFRYKDLDAAGVTLKRNTRFTSIGGRATDVYVTRLQPQGHYQEFGGPTLVKAYFKDRQPARVD